MPPRYSAFLLAGPLLVAGLLLCGAAAPQPRLRTLAESRFDASPEAWQVIDDVDFPARRTPLHNIRGGEDGGGHVFIPSRRSRVLWFAPPAFRGNQSAAYGGRLTFSLMAFVEHPDGPAPAGQDLVPERVGMVLAFRQSGVQTVLTYSIAREGVVNSWTRLEVPLDPARGWKAGYDPEGRAATPAEMLCALSHLEDLGIFHRTAVATPAVMGLDNVVLEGPPYPRGKPIRIRPGRVNFGNVLVGGSKTVPVSVSNDSNLPYTLFFLQPPADVAVRLPEDPCLLVEAVDQAGRTVHGIVLHPRASLNIDLVFTPTSAGALNAQLSVVRYPGAAHVRLPLRGKGVAEPPPPDQIPNIAGVWRWQTTIGTYSFTQSGRGLTGSITGFGEHKRSTGSIRAEWFRPPAPVPGVSSWVGTAEIGRPDERIFSGSCEIVHYSAPDFNPEGLIVPFPGLDGLPNFARELRR